MSHHARLPQYSCIQIRRKQTTRQRRDQAAAAEAPAGPRLAGAAQVTALGAVPADLLASATSVPLSAPPIGTACGRIACHRARATSLAWPRTASLPTTRPAKLASAEALPAPWHVWAAAPPDTWLETRDAALSTCIGASCSVARSAGLGWAVWLGSQASLSCLTCDRHHSITMAIKSRQVRPLGIILLRIRRSGSTCTRHPAPDMDTSLARGVLLMAVWIRHQ